MKNKPEKEPPRPLNVPSFYYFETDMRSNRTDPLFNVHRPAFLMMPGIIEPKKESPPVVKKSNEIDHELAGASLREIKPNHPRWFFR